MIDDSDFYLSYFGLADLRKKVWLAVFEKNTLNYKRNTLKNF